MNTIRENCNAVGSSAYFGENGDWLIACSIHRESDCLSRSNFDTFKKSLESLPEVKNWQGEFAPVTIERFSHWAVGWIDYLIIDPECMPAVALADSLLEKLDSYPVLNEDDFSAKEQEEVEVFWRDCYSSKERIAYVRKFRNQFEFQNMQDMLRCIRGQYFAGYASELIH